MYARAEDILRIALLMEGSHGGMSLQDIQSELKVERRTAERLRDAVGRLFPAMELVSTGERVRRWRLPRGSTNRLVEVTAIELEELALTADRLRMEGMADRASALETLRAKLSVLARPDRRARVETDYEALLESEGHALRPGPRPTLPDGLLDTLRQGLLGLRVLDVVYRGRVSRHAKSLRLEPHGLLFGQRHYLVAYEAGSVSVEPKLYALSNIVSAQPANETFTRRAGLALNAYAERAFGVYQEKPFDVIWRFSPDVAADAREYHFHPTERKRDLPDGSLEVTFTAGGELEMAWHLFTWGAGVTVLTPASLRARYAGMLRSALDTIEAGGVTPGRGCIP
ncbi:helix-turn-helix transcriptional regulator [Belnapia moabensis]|uniref:helix-turn-helix transcriptional regulator n=1 Tax=Belnapia moabensis TaxID=365533 RepID=UPI000694A6CA|nr:WYL domain-containing protein [Belnapia moabensis]